MRPRPGGRRPSTHGFGSDGAIAVLVALGAAAALLSRVPHRRAAIVVGCCLATLALIAGVAVLLSRRRGLVAPERSNPFHRTDRRAPDGWATRTDLVPLLLRDPPGDRIVLGSTQGRLVAAEPRQSVLVVGPSQSGKTRGLAVPAILEWSGPVLATSVKADLVQATIDERRRLGAVAVFDPSQAIGSVATAGERTGWSPLGAAGTWQGARRIAAAMCDVAEGDGGMEDAGFWYASAEKLLAPLLFAAAVSGSSMSDVVRWIDDEEIGEVLLALELAGVAEATRAARTSFRREDRQRSSVFATAETVVAGFADPQLADASRRACIDPASLVSQGSAAPGPRWRPSTLYCCAPAREQQRLRPVFTALVREVIDAAFAGAARSGGPLSPGLLIVLDEAANVAPLAELDAILATAAGHGIQLMTVWQDFAQIEARYGRRWSTIVNNHRAKVVCPGISDPLTLDHVEALIGEHERNEVSTTFDPDGRRSRTEVTALRRLAPAGSLRRLSAGSAALLYGGLPPARVRLRPAVVEERSARRLDRHAMRRRPTKAPPASTTALTAIRSSPRPEGPPGGKP
ncbi:MAG: type IV secretory system conjugative DNA transfer family protein [Acidimicrobiales bacterium]